MKKEVIGATHRFGILGGGQLGRMLIQEAISYDIHVHTMDLNSTDPSATIATSHTVGDIKAYDDVINFGKDKDVISVEIENVNVDALKELESNGVKVFPQPRVLEIIKDKGLQKHFYVENNIPTSPFELTTEDTKNYYYASKVPFVHKLRTGGYDGRGVELIKGEKDLQNAFNAPSILEELVPFEKELSVIVARNEKGETAVYQTVECEFNEVNLVAFLFSPADISNDVETRATELAIDVINKLEMVGILAVELFLLSDGTLLVNEVAPRPHNSGHHTIECNVTSQFEQHMRSVLNLPLGSTEMIREGAMLNLLGEIGHTGRAKYEGLEEVISMPGVHVHLYGKKDTKPNRKMGHITVAQKNIDEAKRVAKQVKGKIRVIAE
ncbi:MAG: 5-(carboxyamino)imidazole ribonucleotide synthase [Crocinitomicaceae bacterium]|nr:5-(carboxyamino)imidazole ribonucleotide synthase [Crocinitomicaceae bacterium]